MMAATTNRNTMMSFPAKPVGLQNVTAMAPTANISVAIACHLE